MNTPLNPDAVTRSIMVYQLRSSCGVEVAGECKACRSVVEAIVSAYLAVAQPVVTGDQINRAGWTCDGIHEPGSYTTCEDCRGACDDLANFYNQMRRTPDATTPWTYRPEVPGA